LEDEEEEEEEEGRRVVAGRRGLRVEGREGGRKR
jgi:hypothetical protein